MRKGRSSAVLVVVYGIAASCSSPTARSAELGPVPDGSLMTNASAYVAERIPGTSRPARYQFAVITRFENRSKAPVYLGRCFPNSPQPEYDLVPGDSSSVRSAYSQIWACVGHDSQFQVAPGAARIDTFHVQGPNMFDETKQEAIGTTSGVFRLMLFVASAPGDGAPRVAGALGLSNAFRVRTSE